MDAIMYLVKHDHQLAFHFLDHVVVERRWEMDDWVSDIHNDHDNVRNLEHSPPMSRHHGKHSMSVFQGVVDAV
jgi:hypothetical protein